MTAIRGVIAGLIGLFIDDGSLALAILGLIAIATAAVKIGWLPPLAGALLLLAGCIALILESVYRAARRKLADRG
jgi:ethanolamine utilization microcompartment shell protein EutS